MDTKTTSAARTCKPEYAYMVRVLGSDAEVWKELEHQFGVLHSRLGFVFTLGALGITVTGFSGHRIVAAGPWSGVPLAVGLIFILASLLVALLSAGRLRWVSTYNQGTVEENFCRIIENRDRKTQLFRMALRLLFTGLFFYVIAVSNYLLRASFGLVPIIFQQ